MSQRIKKVNQLIKKELSKILLKELNFNKEIVITITRVETSVDLTQVKVYVSTLPNTPEVISYLNKNTYFFHKELNKRIKLKRIPKIKFIEEKETAKAARIDELLEKIKRNNQNGE